MYKTKKLLKKLFYILFILIIIFLYNIHEKNVINKKNSFDFFIINIAINDNDTKTIKYKIKNINKKNILKKLQNNNKSLNTKIINNKINIHK